MMFVATAWAQEAAAATTTQPNLLAVLLQYAPMILIFVLFYVLLIRPQMQAAKQHEAMLKDLKKGDVVITDGGMVAEVVKVADVFVSVRVNAEDTLTIMRAGIRKTLTADEAKGWEPAPLAARKK